MKAVEIVYMVKVDKYENKKRLLVPVDEKEYPRRLIYITYLEDSGIPLGP